MSDTKFVGRRASVSIQALTRLIEALNSPPHMILELLNTRHFPMSLVDQENPIDVLERELTNALQGKGPEGQALVTNFSLNVDEKMLEEVFEGVLKNYARMSVDTESDKLLDMMIGQSLIVDRWTNADGKVFYGLSAYEPETLSVHALTSNEYESPRAALIAYYLHQSGGVSHV